MGFIINPYNFAVATEYTFDFQVGGTDHNVDIEVGQSRSAQEINTSTLNAKKIRRMTWYLKNVNQIAVGTVFFRIRLKSTDAIIATTSMNVNTITTSFAPYTLNFAEETLPSAVFYASVEYSGTDRVGIQGAISGTAPNQINSYYNTVWNDLPGRDLNGSLVYID